MKKSIVANLFLATSLIMGATLMASCTANLAGAIGANNPGTNTGANANVAVTLPDPLEIASAVGLKASSCSEEGTIKSAQGAATNVSFKNSSTGKINIYWLDASGQRKSYKMGLAAGATHNQPTFVTHPWLITNDQDQCMGIYTPTDTSNVTLDVKKTVTVSGTGSTSGSVSTDSSAAGLQQRIECLKTKGDNSRALAAQGSLNLYLKANAAGGLVAISAAAYLKQTQDLITQGGC